MLAPILRKNISNPITVEVREFFAFNVIYFGRQMGFLNSMCGNTVFLLLLCADVTDTKLHQLVNVVLTQNTKLLREKHVRTHSNKKKKRKQQQQQHRTHLCAPSNFVEIHFEHLFRFPNSTNSNDRKEYGLKNNRSKIRMEYID